MLDSQPLQVSDSSMINENMTAVDASTYPFFRRDMSWLAFNERVLMEAADRTLPVYDRIKFLSIFSSNLEEFYTVRVAYHQAVLQKRRDRNDAEEDADADVHILQAIRETVMRQDDHYYRIFYDQILPTLEEHGIRLRTHAPSHPDHRAYLRRFFHEEVFPLLYPMLLLPGKVRTFIRSGRVYLAVRLHEIGAAENEYSYALLNVPTDGLPRFVDMPRLQTDTFHYYSFLEDIIKEHLDVVFPGYEVLDSYSIKVSRDADLLLDVQRTEDLPGEIRKKVKTRKLGAPTRFMYDGRMPEDVLHYICSSCDIDPEEAIRSGNYVNLQDLAHLPNPFAPRLETVTPEPLLSRQLEQAPSLMEGIRQRDYLNHVPYHTYDYVVRLLLEAAFSPDVSEIRLTQYRVAENSSIISALEAAAQSGKKVSVFVELKARFDEENNLRLSERMRRSGIRIVYSMPGLKVHAKTALILHHPRAGERPQGIALLSTGNFNETTARIYSDTTLMTANTDIVHDVYRLFRILDGDPEPARFTRLLVARYNMSEAITHLIDREIEHVKQGRRGYMLLKMNGLQDKNVITQLYKASEAGVEIDLIVRGICCLVPDMPQSRNIRVTRLVDMYLEHSRIWCFHNAGDEEVFISSADWMKRNLYNRIETACPVLDPVLRREIIDILEIQLSDNIKACRIDSSLNNIYKHNSSAVPVRAQTAIYRYLKEKEEAISL